MQTADRINLAIAIIAALSTVMSLAVVIATFKILRANRETVQVMREQMLALNRPYIQVVPWVRTGSTMLMLSVKNSGASAAEDVHLELDRDFYFNGDSSAAKSLKGYAAFTERIASLPPQADLSFHLGVGHKVFAMPSMCPPKFVVTAKYGFSGQAFTEQTTIDLTPFMHTAMPTDPVVEQLKELNQTARAVAQGMSRA